MSFATLTPDEVDEVFRSNLVLAGQATSQLSAARKAAEAQTKGMVRGAAWRNYRSAMRELSAPEFRPSTEVPGMTERVRRNRSGALRVDLVPTTTTAAS